MFLYMRQLVIIQQTMKKALRETQTLRAGCSKAEPKNFAPPQPPSDLSRPPGSYNPPVFMRHPQPSEVQRGLSGGGGVFTWGVHVIVMEGVKY